MGAFLFYNNKTFTMFPYSDPHSSIFDLEEPAAENSLMYFKVKPFNGVHNKVIRFKTVDPIDITKVIKTETLVIQVRLESLQKPC